MTSEANSYHPLLFLGREHEKVQIYRGESGENEIYIGEKKLLGLRAL